MLTWKNDDELFALMKKDLYSAVIGDILDQMGHYHQFLPMAVQPIREDMVVCGRAMTVKEEEQMNENAYQLIVAITNTGYTDAVMEAASAAGARGGTVIHARATDAGNTNKFFGMAISEEREMIFLVTSADKRAAIMQSIMEKAGAHTEAQTVTFSVPLDDAAGLYSTDSN